MTTIERVGVVIPAHDEAEVLPDSLAAIERSLRGVHCRAHVVVVLDDCTDASDRVLSRFPWVETVQISARNVGIARAAGAEAILRWSGSTPLHRIWLASTDADSVVPAGWLSGQIRLAESGWEVVLGTVRVDDWDGHAPAVERRWRAGYRDIEDHPHVHGANLGCTAAAYRDAGGWAPRSCGEDVALAAALAHRRVLRTAALPVTTSARTAPRAPGGFGDTLAAYAG